MASWARAALLASCLGLTVQPSVAGAATQPACPNEALRTGPSAALPDCRAFEQVSPVQKNFFEAVTPDFPMQATPNGEAFAYLSFVGAFSGAPSGSYPDAYVARRTAEGWQTTNASPPTPDATPAGGQEVGYAFSEDLSQVITWLPLQQLAAGATPGVFNLFSSGTTSARSYAWVNAVTPPHVPPEGCPPQSLAACFQFPQNLAAFAGASADYQRVLFESGASLVAGAPEGIGSLYESVFEGGAWHVSLAGVLPDGTIPGGGSAPGSGGPLNGLFYKSHNAGADNRVANAISQDGSRVVFQANADEGVLPAEAGQNGMTEVYDRLNGAETIELSAPAPGANPPAAQPAMFWAASADGSRVYFTSLAELTTESFTGAPICEPEEGKLAGCFDHGDLYEYDLETETLRDLTVDTNLPADEEEGAAVQGVLGASSDGSYVYFVAKGQLVAGKGVDHAENLYMVHDGGTPVYITTLSESDGGDWTEVASALESYVTPDGKHLAFSSVESLATANFPGGYHNEGRPEVYEYSTPGEGEGESLICVSCNPSGAPPVGPSLLGGVKQPGTGGPSDSTPFHPVRVVSDNGARVFFSSKDPLTPAASGNTQIKVFEHERDGEGECQTSGGCIFLLSSPESPQGATFLDADSEGNNVFLASVSQLTAADHDHEFDVYDARVNGGLAEPPTEAPCEANCRQLGLTSPPSSALLTGFAAASGNLAAPSGGKKTAQTKARKLKRALRACRRKRSGRKRRLCEAKARRRYAHATRSDHRGTSRGR